MNETGVIKDYHKKKETSSDVSQKTIPQTKTPNMKKT
jgi:hypothetical protein